MQDLISNLKNKVQDIERALARHDLLSPKWYAYELGLQLEHAEQEFELRDHRVLGVSLPRDADGRIENQFKAIRSEVERLRSCLVDQTPEAAQESLRAVCSLFAQLHASFGDA